MTMLRHSTLATLALIGMSVAALAQTPDALSVLPLKQITRPAGVIFAGKVVGLDYEKPRTNTEVGVMRVTFQVERGLRGVKDGSTLTIREWAGLWNSGERYRVGERVVLFLYPHSKLGLTSPVGGPRGRFAIAPGGEVILGPDRERPSPIKRLPRTLLPEKTGRVTLHEFTQAIRRFAARER